MVAGLRQSLCPYHHLSVPHIMSDRSTAKRLVRSADLGLLFVDDSHSTLRTVFIMVIDRT